MNNIVNKRPMSRKYLVIATLTIALFACDKSTKNDSNDVESNEASENGYVLKGKIENFTEGGSVILNQLIGQNVVKKDSASISKDGSFKFKGNVSVPDFYQIILTDGSNMVFILDNKELGFTADKINFENTKKIIGSVDTDVLVQLTAEVNARNAIRQSLNAKMMEAQQQKNEELMQQISDEYQVIEAKNIQKMKAVIAANTHSFVAAIGTMSFLNPATDFQFMDSISTILNQTNPDSRYTKDLVTKVNSLRNVSIGSMAPQISLPNPDGTTQSLSDLKGKYVLIDFWASWCGPCRKENPNVVKMYAKFKGEKFEIFGVSLDKSGEKWRNAIQKDGITWWQVSDLQGWQSSAAEKYKVQSIPATFLIDPDGKIIAKNLRGVELEEKMKEILG